MVNYLLNKVALPSGVLFSPPASWAAEGDFRSRRSPVTIPPQTIAAYYKFPIFEPTERRKPVAGPGVSNLRSPPSSPSSPSLEQPISDPATNTTLCLPLLSVSVDVTVDGMVAYTELRQSFHNPSELVILEAVHTFPLYDGAVVASFECTVGSARVLRGVVKPREQARQEFEMAKREKREAVALLEELTPEIFETSLGNIPPNTTVEIKLAYMHELKVVMLEHETAEGLAVTIPTSIAPRYGGMGTLISASELASNKLDIWVRVVDNGTINVDGCHVESGHWVEYKGTEPVKMPVVASIKELGKVPLQSTNAPQMQSVWHHTSSSSVLKADFILIVQMREQHKLRSHATFAPPIHHDSGDCQAALVLHIRPSDVFFSAVRPESFSGEILFLLDRSDSMGWTSADGSPLKIDTMRHAMSLVLSEMPSTCAFNIISFGNEVRGMWVESRPTCEDGNLKYAQGLLPQVKADMGGTEILLALRGAVESRNRGRTSTQIILVTDGEVNESRSPILQFVWRTRQELQNKVRFFTLGIGDRVSHRMMEGIAGLGGGLCDIVGVAKKPRWEGRLNHMLRSAMGPDSWAFDISLGAGYERCSLLTFKSGTDKLPDKSLSPYVQSPCPVSGVLPYTYKSIFFLLDLSEGQKPPSEVILQTKTDGAESKTCSMKVETVQINNGTIHHLAAKAALIDLEAEVKKEDIEPDVARINAEYIGQKYSINSKWTSFVAVAEEEGDQAQKSLEVNVYKSIAKDIDIEDFSKMDANERTDELSHLLPVKVDSFRPSPKYSFPNAIPQSCYPTSTSIRSNALCFSNSAPSRCQGREQSYDKGTISFSYPASDVDAIPWMPFPRGPITWQDAVKSQAADSTFALQDVDRSKLQLHFCPNTTQRLREEIAKLSTPADQTDETEAVAAAMAILADTLMMLQYLRTHSATEEDSWAQLEDEAERAVVKMLGYEEGREDKLEPLYEILRLSMEHVHFDHALKFSCVGRKGQDESQAERVAMTCLVCTKAVDVECLERNNTGFVCLSDECYYVGSEGRKVRNTWDSFWGHQVQSGHMPCTFWMAD